MSHKLIAYKKSAFQVSSSSSADSESGSKFPVYEVTEMATCVEDKFVPAQTRRQIYENANSHERRVGNIARDACSCLESIQNYRGDKYETGAMTRKDFMGHSVIQGVMQCAERENKSQFNTAYSLWVHGIDYRVKLRECRRTYKKEQPC